MERDIHDKQVIKTALHSKVPTSRRVDKINTNQPTNEATDDDNKSNESLKFALVRLKKLVFHLFVSNGTGTSFVS